MTKNNGRLAVIISDIHFNLNTLELATKALSAAIARAEKYKLPLIIAGDLHDTKAIIRAEVANRLLTLFMDAAAREVDIYVLVGNHDRINEKAPAHGLNYLSNFATIVTSPITLNGITLLPYYHDVEELKHAIAQVKTKHVVMHQGVKGAFMGDYVQDKSSIDPKELEHLNVISGHYHKHQTVGTVTYVGSPFTMSFGEARDGYKGYLVLHDSGIYEFIPLALPRHRIFEYHIKVVSDINNYADVSSIIDPADKLWVKIEGPESELKKIKRSELGAKLFGHTNFKLDLIPTDTVEIEADTLKMTNHEVFDMLIDNLGETDTQKKNLKELWREIIEG